MPIVEHLIRSGVIADPSPLTRPLRRDQIVAALRAVDTTAVTLAVRESIRSILYAYRTVGDGPQYWVRGYVGAGSSTQGRRDALRPLGEGSTTAHAGGELQTSFGPVVMASHGFADGRLQNDPDYTGRRDKSPPHRFTDAYASLQSQYARLFVGAIDRNWGPAGMPGTIVSSEPYSYDHVMVELGTRHLRVDVLYTDLDPFRDADGARINRNWVTQRVIVRPVDWFVGALTQATLWVGGGRGMELRWLNPFKVTRSTDIDEPLPGDSVNSVYGMELWVKAPRGITFQGEFMIDDFGFQFGSSAPDRLAATTVVDIPTGFNSAVRGSFTFVSSLAYRTTVPAETIMRRGIGLGRNFADYTETAVSLTTMPLPNVVIQPEVILLRQGEGDFRKPFPTLPASDQPFLFEGVIERTWRLGVRAHLAPTRYIDAQGHLGVHFIGNDAHVLGVNRTEVVAGIRVSFRLDGPVVLH